MKAKDLRSLSKSDLNSKLEELRKEMIKHNAQISTGTTPKSPGQVRETKKTIAKILTIVGTQRVSSKQKETSEVPKAEVKEDAKPKETKEAPKNEEKNNG
ncbi:MAG: 50S ribosomal protein L29 [Candidatus Woesearchaeota archaeon]